MQNQNKFHYKAMMFLSFAGPAVILFSAVVIVPFIFGLYLTFTGWDGISSSIPFVGLENYFALFQDGSFWVSLGRTILCAFIAVILANVVAFGLAYLVTSNIKGSNFFRAVFYWPTMISTIIVGLTWRFLLGEDFGLVNYLLTAMDKTPVKWLTDPNNAMGVVIFVTVWSMAGYYMVMFVSGIKAISETYYEAARIDGAGAWQQFRFITLPLLKPTSLLVLVLSTVSIIKTYPLVYSLTQGGPAGATKFMVQMIQETGFEKNKMGYASAMTMALFLILALFTIIQFKLNQGGEQDAD